MFELPVEEAIQRCGQKIESMLPEVTTKFVERQNEFGGIQSPEGYRKNWYRWIGRAFHDDFGDSTFIEAEDCFAWSGHCEADGYLYLLDFLFKHKVIPYMIFIYWYKDELKLQAMSGVTKEYLTEPYRIDLNKFEPSIDNLKVTR